MQITTFSTCVFFILHIPASMASINIALKKNASQSSNINETEFLAHLAVDGDASRNPGKCTHTDDRVIPREAWWQVDLWLLSEIKFINIYYDDSTGYRFDGFKVYVSQTSKPWRNESPCYEDTEIGYPPPDLIINSCAGYGKYVTVFSDNMYSINEPIVELCEVEVYGCIIGKYGPSCNDTCSSNCVKNRCDPDFGNCKECKDNHFGTECNNVCHCNNGSCDRIAGKCNIPGCQAGWKGENCSTACHEDHFGRDCNNVCHCNTGSCNRMSGKCNINGCQVGWKGENCDTACEEHHFGKDCKNMCHCYKGGCDHVTGLCKISAGCKTGWKGESCDTECSSNEFGPGCIYNCECISERCDSQNGVCVTYGCKPGWKGHRCNQKCSNGTFGPGCTGECHCETGDCNHISGICADKGCGCCISGWQGESCDRKVDTGSSSSSLIPGFIGGVVGFLLSSVIFSIVIVIHWRRNKLKLNKGDNYEDTKRPKTQNESNYDELEL